MHQSREIALRQGFDPSKDRHLIWMLRKFVSDNKRQSLIDLQHKSEFLAGHVSFAENLLNQLENTRTFTTPLPNNITSTLWYCLNCGDLDPEEVTNDEHCALCGNKL
jgi:rubrerythrin